MASVITRSGRSGFYARIAVPRDLWAEHSSHSVLRKLTAQNRRAAEVEARALQVQYDKEFQDLRRHSEGHPRASTGRLESIQRVLAASPIKQLSQDDKETIHHIVIDSLRLDEQGTTDEEGQQVWRSYRAWEESQEPFRTWIDRRAQAEDTRTTTIANWSLYLGRLAEWAGTDRLGGLSRKDAVGFKEFLLEQVSPKTGRRFTGAYVRNHLKCFVGFWSWGHAHEQVKHPGIWEGLARGIREEHNERQLPDFSNADRLASDDLRYQLQRYTGARSNEVNGLRWEDFDLDANTVRFVEWSGDGFVRHLKGGRKDERTVPLHPRCRELVVDLMVNASGTQRGPIWSNAYKPSRQTWGDTWAGEMPRRYGVHSHDLRRRVVTQLSLRHSPFITYAVTRHAIPGMSRVVMGYTLPTIQDLRPVIEALE